MPNKRSVSSSVLYDGKGQKRKVWHFYSRECINSKGQSLKGSDIKMNTHLEPFHSGKHNNTFRQNNGLNLELCKWITSSEIWAVVKPRRVLSWDGNSTMLCLFTIPTTKPRRGLCVWKYFSKLKGEIVVGKFFTSYFKRGSHCEDVWDDRAGENTHDLLEWRKEFQQFLHHWT